MLNNCDQIKGKSREFSCFGEHGIYDGGVVGSDLVDGRTVWRVLYSDGDREDLDDDELLDILVDL